MVFVGAVGVEVVALKAQKTVAWAIGFADRAFMLRTEPVPVSSLRVPIPCPTQGGGLQPPPPHYRLAPPEARQATAWHAQNQTSGQPNQLPAWLRLARSRCSPRRAGVRSCAVLPFSPLPPEFRYSSRSLHQVRCAASRLRPVFINLRFTKLPVHIRAAPGAAILRARTQGVRG